MDIQCKVEDASDLQSGGGTAGAADDRRFMLGKVIGSQKTFFKPEN